MGDKNQNSNTEKTASRRNFFNAAPTVADGFIITITSLLFSTTGLISEPIAAQPAQSVSPQRMLLNQYCIACHNETMVNTTPMEGENLLFTQLRGLGLTLDTENVDNVSENPQLWEKVVRKLRVATTG